MRRGAAALVVLLLTGCGSERPAPPPLPATGSRALPPPLPTCPGTGHWEACTVFDRLERAGLAPQPRDTLRVTWLKVPGATWGVGRGVIHVFRYRDSTARRADVATLDSARARPRTDTTTTWPLPPTLLVNDNLLAILLSDNGEQVERVTLALTAGPPPPAPPAK